MAHASVRVRTGGADVRVAGTPAVQSYAQPQPPQPPRQQPQRASSTPLAECILCDYRGPTKEHVCPGRPQPSRPVPTTPITPTPTAPEPEEVEAEVVGVSRHASDPRKRPTNAEIAAHAANALDMSAGAAQTFGAEGAAEVMREAANAARTIPVAVEGVKRELEPPVRAIGGLWNAMERRGWVGMRKPINIAELQGRGRPKSEKK